MAFWRDKKLVELSRSEWEMLCDGCAKCCLLKLEDTDTGEIHYTSVACSLLDLKTCRCTKYKSRHKLVPECIWLTPGNVRDLSWLPKTCAYRIVAKGGDLPLWHPLVSKNPESIFDSGVAIRSFATLQIGDENLEDMLISGVA